MLRWGARQCCRAALTEGPLDEAFDWLSRLVAHDGQPAHYRAAVFGLIDLAEVGRRNGRRSETSQLAEGAQASIQGELSPRLLQVSALCRALLAEEP